MTSKSKPKSDSKSKSKSKSKSIPEPETHLSYNKSTPLPLPLPPPPPPSSSSPIPNPKPPKLKSTPNPKSMSISSSASRKRVSKDLEEDDILVIANGFLRFKVQHGGSNPTPTTISSLLDAVNSSLHHRLTADQLYNKFRSLRHKYNRIATAGGPGPAASQFDRNFFDIAVKVWGVKSGERKVEKKVKAENGKSHHLADNGVKNDGEDEEMEDAEDVEDEEEDGGEEKEVEEEVEEPARAKEEPVKEEPAKEEEAGEDDLEEEFEVICESYPYLARGLKGAWEEKGNSMEALKVGMKFMDRKKAKKLDAKWKRHFVEGLEIKGLEFQVGHRAVEVVVAGFKGEVATAGFKGEMVAAGFKGEEDS